MRKVFLLLATLFAASACNKKVKEQIGIVTPGPNEYQVHRNKSLEMPPHYDLPMPTTHNRPIHNDDKKRSSDKLNEGEKAILEEIETHK